MCSFRVGLDTRSRSRSAYDSIWLACPDIDVPFSVIVSKGTQDDFAPYALQLRTSPNLHKRLGRAHIAVFLMPC